MATEDQRGRALGLVGQGHSMRAAARAVGVSKTTVGRWLGTVPQEKKVDSAAIEEGLGILRERVFRAVVARVLSKIETAPARDLQRELTAYGIADDKLVGRGNGVQVTAQASAKAEAGVIILESHIPRPQFDRSETGQISPPERPRDENS